MLKLVAALLPKGQELEWRGTEWCIDQRPWAISLQGESQHGTTTCVDKYSLSSSLMKDVIYISSTPPPPHVTPRPTILLCTDFTLLCERKSWTFSDFHEVYYLLP